MTFEHAGIRLSFMQRIDGYLVALEDFDYSCSLGYINGQCSHLGEMNVAESLKLHFLSFSSPLLSRTNIGSKNLFALSMEGIGTL